MGVVFADVVYLFHMMAMFCLLLYIYSNGLLFLRYGTGETNFDDDGIGTEKERKIAFLDYVAVGAAEYLI